MTSLNARQASETYAFAASPAVCPVRRLEDWLTNAVECYAADNGDGWSRAYQLGREYTAEGQAIGDEAFDMPAEDRDDWIEGQTYAFDESARYLIGCAADLRVAELVREDALRVTA